MWDELLEQGAPRSEPQIVESFLPCRLKVGRGNLLGPVLDLMQLRDKAMSRGHLQAATSAVHVDVTRSGAVHTHRLDFLIGSHEPGRGASP